MGNKYESSEGKTHVFGFDRSHGGQESNQSQSTDGQLQKEIGFLVMPGLATKIIYETNFISNKLREN